ncbi:hypothetical protein [Nocardia sp. BMG51109]|uniref:LppU family putative lipoprotein n=1 Tax=Nocardia sp. BMG51109 TaxID=1056816 RepID=UPI0004637CFC|nr:hypothetical protein [Nocardia sp. BMG51109]
MSYPLASVRILLPASAVVVLGLAGCGSTVGGHPTAAGGGAAQSATSTGSAPTSKPPATGGDVDFQAQVGDCVQLGGTTEEATIEHAACGGRESNYKVVGKAPTSDECASDTDNVYYETLRGRETGALCLDRDWVVGGCMDIGGDVAERIECTQPAVEGVRVLTILPNTDSVDACPHDDGGFVYDQRRFVVCVQNL